MMRISTTRSIASALSEMKTGNISYVRNEMEVFPLAEQCCKKYGRSSRFRSITGVRALHSLTRPA